MSSDKKGNSQWAEGFGTLFGGGHISLGAVKRRSTGIARAVSDSATAVASFVGATAGLAEDDIMGDLAEEDQQFQSDPASQQLRGAGSVNLEATTAPKDVFEFEAN